MILTKSEYIASINSLLADNSTQEISPLDLRTSLIDLIDSVHNFMDGKEIDASNFSTPDTRTTRAGDLSLHHLDQNLAGRSTSDSSAFGYASLRANYDGVENTAFGSYSMSCNLNGSYNTAIGYQSVAGNTIGSGNVGVGSFSLNNNKTGDLNIAIGHGAGYYIGKDDNYKFYLGSHAIASGDMCVGDTPVTSGDAPLLFGNLEPLNHKLGVGVNVLHDYGMLQVSGDVSPSTSGTFSLGKSRYPWSSINDEIFFSGGVVGVGGQPSGAAQGVSDGRLTVYGDLLPSQNGRYALGYQGNGGGNQLLWDAYLNDVIISGQLTVNDFQYNTVSNCLYECKTLHLATSGFCDPEDDGFHNSSVCGFMDDTSLDGAGLEIHSSGATYRRDYRFIYKMPDASLSCLDVDTAFSRSRFHSNISIEIDSGKALISERVLGRRKSATVLQSGCMGMFLEPFSVSGQRFIFAQEPHVNNQYSTLTDVNFISRSGTHTLNGNPVGYDFAGQYATVDSGVKIGHRFSSRIKTQSGKRGFSIVYHDEMDLGGNIGGGQVGVNDGPGAGGGSDIDGGDVTPDPPADPPIGGGGGGGAGGGTGGTGGGTGGTGGGMVGFG